jgi:hypothetical protein
MDPYLESPDLWPDVHNRLITIFCDDLIPLIAPHYVAELQTQIIIEEVNREDESLGVVHDVAIIQPMGFGGVVSAAASAPPAPIELHLPLRFPIRLNSVRIRRREDDRLATIIEMLSPFNKRPGPGRDEYVEKRSAFTARGINLVEVDLLRRWPRMPFELSAPVCDYLIMVADCSKGTRCDVWPIFLRQELPVIPIPLLPPDAPVPLDIALALRTAYSRARYDLRIDYAKPANPPLRAADAEWAAALLVSHAVH